MIANTTFFAAQRGVGPLRRPSTRSHGDLRLSETPGRDKIGLKSAVGNAGFAQKSAMRNHASQRARMCGLIFNYLREVSNHLREVSMTTKQSNLCNNALNSTLSLISWCMVPSFCMVMALSPTMAGTNGTSGIRMPAGKSTPLSGSARQGDASARVVVLGVSLAEWTQRFWDRFMSIPVNVGPATDKTGIECGINQSGPVWFLGAPLGGTNQLSCTIPAGKMILAPAVTFINDYPCPEPPSFEPQPGQTLEDFLTEGVIPIIDSSFSTVELDGRLLKPLRVTANLQSFTGAKDIAPAVDPCVTGSPQLGVADGLYVMIGPLSPGLHILHIHANSPAGSADNTFRLTIK